MYQLRITISLGGRRPVAARASALQAYQIYQAYQT
jgi:hypothetical protein